MTNHDEPEATRGGTRPRRTRTVLLAAGAVVVVLVGGGLAAANLLGGEPAAAPAPAPAATGTSTPEPTTVTSPPATAVPTPTTPAATTSAAPTPDAVPATTSAPAAAPLPTAPQPGYPPAFTDFQLNGYEQLWAVYVAVGELGDPAVTAGRERLAGVGYSSSSSTLGCDQGAAEALGLDPSLDSAAVYFATPEQAEQLVALWGDPVVGTALVTIGCNDGA